MVQDARGADSRGTREVQNGNRDRPASDPLRTHTLFGVVAGQHRGHGVCLVGGSMFDTPPPPPFPVLFSSGHMGGGEKGQIVVHTTLVWYFFWGVRLGIRDLPQASSWLYS